MAESESTNFFSHAWYDRLKFFAQIILPALGTLVFVVGGIWGWDATTKTVGTITAVDLFLGAILQISSNNYYKSGANFDGDVNVTKDPETGENAVAFAFENDPRDVVDDPGKHSLEFRINHSGEDPSK
jgi:hypothetical protein